MLLRRSQLAVRDCLVEVGLGLGVDSVLQTGHGLALCTRDLGECLSSVELRAQLGLAQAEVARDGGAEEPEADLEIAGRSGSAVDVHLDGDCRAAGVARSGGPAEPACRVCPAGTGRERNCGTGGGDHGSLAHLLLLSSRDEDSVGATAEKAVSRS